jgi:hypothetical protein
MLDDQINRHEVSKDSQLFCFVLFCFVLSRSFVRFCTVWETMFFESINHKPPASFGSLVFKIEAY